MDGCVSKCIFRLGLPLILTGAVLGFIAIANIKPEYLEKVNTQIIKMVQFDKTESKESYRVEPSAFGE